MSKPTPVTTRPPPRDPVEDVLDLVVIGAGPAGVAAAVEARHHGLESILVLEKGPSHSHMIRTFYKEGKPVEAAYQGISALSTGLLHLEDGDRESYLAFIDDLLERYAVPIEYRVEVNSIRQLDNSPRGHPLYEVTAGRQRYVTRHVVIAIGRMGRPRRPDYYRKIPRALRSRKKILFDLNTIEIIGQEVLVVGGGDSAAEYCQLLAPRNTVTLCYRRAEFTRPTPRNQEALERLIASGAVRLRMPADIQKIENEAGRPLVHYKSPELAPETYDVVVYALGGMTPAEFLDAAELDLGGDGYPLTNDSTHESSRRGIFVAGDLLGRPHGGGSIVAAFNSAADAVHALLAKRGGPPPPAPDESGARAGTGCSRGLLHRRKPRRDCATPRPLERAEAAPK